MKDILHFKDSLKRFMLNYKFGMDELNTKINILKEEFEFIHDYNPIEHVKSRLKTPESVLRKIRRKGLSLDLEDIKNPKENGYQSLHLICMIPVFMSDRQLIR